MDYLDRVELAKVLSEAVMRLPVERVEAALADGESAFAPLVADLGLADRDYAETLMLFAYELRYRFHQRAQARALPLLRSLLTPKQRRDVRSRMTFEVIGSEGGHYRLAPFGSSITRTVDVNGRRFSAIRYCWHDPESVLCPGDVMLAAMLQILADEPAFLAEANPTLTPWFERRVWRADPALTAEIIPAVRSWFYRAVPGVPA